MRNVEDDPGRRRAHRVDQRVERGLAEVVEPVEHRRSGQQAQVVAAFRQQAIDESWRRRVRARTRLRRRLAEDPD